MGGGGAGSPLLRMDRQYGKEFGRRQTATVFLPKEAKECMEQGEQGLY